MRWVFDLLDFTTSPLPRPRRIPDIIGGVILTGSFRKKLKRRAWKRRRSSGCHRT